MKFGFDHVHLVGSDLDASERFYRDMFGAVEDLRAKGVKVLQEPTQVRPGTQVAFVEGPDHTRIEVLQRDEPI